MISWPDFQAYQPELARQGAGLLYNYGVGLAFLGTVRADGGPRLHPMCPLLTGTGLYAFIVPSPKQADLHRDGRYAMHSFPLEDSEDAFVFVCKCCQPASLTGISPYRATILPETRASLCSTLPLNVSTQRD